MFTQLNYRQARGIQICIVFTATLALQRLFAYEHAGWIGFFVMVIYAGFDSGSSIQRIWLRFIGTMYGLFLSLVLLFFTQWNANLLPIVISIVFYFAFFSLSKAYSIPTIFTVTLTSLGTAYYSSIAYQPIDFFFDYFRSAVIALSICIFFEYVFFRKLRLTEKFYQELHDEFMVLLHQLLACAMIRPIRQSQFLKLCIQCDTKMMEFNNFLTALPYDLSYKYSTNNTHIKHSEAFIVQSHLAETQHLFNDNIERIFYNIHQIKFLSIDKATELALTTQTLLTHIDKVHNPLYGFKRSTA